LPTCSGGRDVNLSFASMASVVPHIKAGKVRALTITTANRLAALPDVPTTAETGFPSLVIYRGTACSRRSARAAS
jgi:tripartite-type tricarboxylate transporter receptor subunit TctC